MMNSERQTDVPKRGPLRQVGTLMVIVMVALLVGLLIYGLVAKSSNTTIDDGLGQGRSVAAPEYELKVLQEGNLGEKLKQSVAPALTDQVVSSSELKGTPYVLNFWASWCVPCREEAPLLERSWRQARKQGVLFVGLNMQDITEDARAFMREFKIGYLNIRDPSNTIARSYGVTGVPETYFISTEGKIVGHVIGVVSADQLRDGIKAARSGRPVAAREGGAQKPTR